MRLSKTLQLLLSTLYLFAINSGSLLLNTQAPALLPLHDTDSIIIIEVPDRVFDRLPTAVDPA